MSVKGQSIRGLYLISDTEFSGGRGHDLVVRAGIMGGASAVQLRGKSRAVGDLFPVALLLREITRQAGVVFIINDSIELAMAVEADGVHLGQDDFPVRAARKLLGGDKIIGVSTHSLDQAQAAEKEGADYIGYGPVFMTGTKDAGEAKGAAGLKAVREKINIPIVAIGGINSGNAKSIINAGADAVAVISAITWADDIEKAAREIAVLFD
jgi:thiamine-phosphate diphosphorylase